MMKNLFPIRNLMLIWTICLFLTFKWTRGQECSGNEEMGYPGNGDLSSVGKKLDGLGARTGYIVPPSMVSYTAPCCGYIKQIDYFHESSGTTQAQVWRLTSDPSYQLVGKITISGNSDKMYNVPAADRIRVEKGDVVGWYSDNANVLSYKDDNAYDDTLYRTFTTAPSLNDVVNWGTGTTALQNRFYAIKYFLDKNAAPTFTSLPATTTTNNGATVNTLLHTITVTDTDVADQTSLTVTLKETNSFFSFDSTTKEIRIASILTGAVGNHYLVFIVTDLCLNSATSTLTVTVTNVPPTIHNLQNSTSVSEDTYAATLLYTLTVTDPTDTVSCSPGTTGVPFNVRQISGSTSYGIYSQSNPGFRYDTKKSYTLSILCTDGYNSTTGTFIVYLLRNEAPVITNLGATVEVSTSSTTGTIAYTVTSTDAENDQLYYNMTCTPSPCPFIIFNSGVIQVTENLQSHQTIGYDLKVYVYDGRTLVGPKTLTIDIINIKGAVNINNLPLGSALTVSENTALGTLVFQISVTDPDIGDTHTYTMSSPGSGLSYFGINSTGVVSTSGLVLNYETLSTTTFDFSVKVSDSTSSNTKILRIQIINQNEAPSFSQAIYAISAEEAMSGTALPDPGISVTDPDSGDTKTFSNDCSTNTGLFSMLASTGRLKFASNYDYDLGTLPTLVNCTVTVTDSGGLTATAKLSVTINNINDNTPVFSSSVYSFFAGYNAPVPTVIGIVTATDGDLGIYGDFTYSLDQSSLSKTYFGIKSDSGEVYVASSVQSIGIGNSVTFKAIATDSGGFSSTSLITVKISLTATLATTTTTNKYRTFFDDGRNVAWFVVLCICLAATAVAILWFVCEINRKGCPKIKICRKRSKIIRIKKVKGVKRPAKPEKIRKMPPTPAEAPAFPLPTPRPLSPYKGFDFWREKDFKKNVLS